MQLTSNGSTVGNLVFDLPGAVTYGGLIGGVGNLTQAGTGILTLTGSNTSSGQTSVSAGTLQLGVGGATGTLTGSIIVSNAGTFLLDRSGTMSNGLGGTGPLIKIGSDSVTLNGNLSGFSGPISVTQGQLVLASAGTASAYTASNGSLQFFGASYNFGTANAMILAQSGGVVQFNGTTVNLGISAGNVTALSSGLIQFNNSVIYSSPNIAINTFPGGVIQFQNATIYGGVLSSYGGGVYQILAGSSATTFSGITINNSVPVQQNGTALFSNVTNAGLITGSGGLTLRGGVNEGGTLILGGTNYLSQWNGNDGGVMIIPSGGLLDNQYGDLKIWGGGQLTINSGGTLNTAIDNQGEALDITAGPLVNNGTILGTTNVNYGATVSGSGTFGQINVSAGTLAVLGGTIQSSGVMLGNASTSPVTNATIMGSGVVAASGTIATTVTVTPAAGLTLTLANSLSGAGQLIENGQGTLLLTGSNSYSGGTTIASGTLQVGNGGSGASLGGGPVLDNGALVFNHSDVLTFAPAISGNGSLRQTGTGVLTLPGSNTYTGPRPSIPARSK